MRNFEIRVNEIEPQGEYDILGMIDGEIVKSQKETCFENVLIESNKFWHEFLDNYGYDSRCDNLIANFGIEWLYN